MASRGWKETSLDITADDRVWTPIGVGALNIGSVECLSELVANSIDWRRLSKVEIAKVKEEIKSGSQDRATYLEKFGRLRDVPPAEPFVKIVVGKNSILVMDNGVGMDLKDLEVALKLRGADDKRRVPLRVRKGMFGMGLKVGVLGMGWKVTVQTRSFSEAGVEHRITIDTRQIEAGELRLKDVKAFSGPHKNGGSLGDLDSGTAILVEDLHKRKLDAVTFRQELGRNFGPEIEYQQVKITVEDHTVSPPQMLDPCVPEKVAIIPETKIELDDDKLLVAPDNGDGTRGKPMRIWGWLALRQVSGSGSGIWGVHTFRRGQLVEAYHKDGPTGHGLLPKDPHPEFARLHGEIHLDMCNPNFTKVGWNTELLSWEEARDKLEPFLSKMMESSRAFRKKTGGAAAVQMIQSFKEVANATIAKVTKAIGDEETKSLTAPEDALSKDVVKLEDGTRLKISVTMQDFTNVVETEEFWRYSYREESDEMAVFVNRQSILWQSGQSNRQPKGFAEMITNWAILDSLYFCLVNDFAYDPNRALAQRTKWLRRVYSDREEVQK